MLIAVFLFVSEMNNMISYVNLTSSPEYRMAMEQIKAYATGSMLFNTEWMLTTSIISLVLDATTFIVSFGLFKRKKWGRISYVLLVWIQAGYYVCSAIGGYYLARSFASQIGQLIGTTGILAFGGYATVFGALIVVATAAFVVWKLSSESVRQEFAQPQTESPAR